jgi:S-adenosylmethionine decarboxylase
MDNIFGRHVIGELYECKNAIQYDNETKLKALLVECAYVANATVLSVSTHKFEPQGISGLVYLAESHISCHIWSQRKYVSLDCYSCGENTYPNKAVANFIEKIQCEAGYYFDFNRGIEVENMYDLIPLDISVIRNSIIN